jgi:ABC-type dipeptide/oligopeptide/nickel transport system permease subunit
MTEQATSSPTTPQATRQSRLADAALAHELDRVARRKSRGFWSQAWVRFRHNRLSLVALAITILIVACVLGAGLISRYVTGFTPYENHLADKLTPPFTNGYILGSDGNGRDVLTRLVYGGRASLMIAGLTTITILLIGATLGAISGYFMGWTDTIIMRMVDVLLSIPTLPLLVLISSMFRPGPAMLSLFVALVSWSGIARLVRGEVLKLRGQEFVEAARLMGGSNARIIFRHIFPNVVPIIVVWASLVIPGLILLEATLSYFGLGVKVPTPSWGNMLQDSKQFFRSNWTLVFIPGVTIYITVLCIYLVGSGLRDALDPRLGEK